MLVTLMIMIRVLLGFMWNSRSRILLCSQSQTHSQRQLQTHSQRHPGALLLIFHVEFLFSSSAVLADHLAGYDDNDDDDDNGDEDGDGNDDDDDADDDDTDHSGVAVLGSLSLSLSLSRSVADDHGGASELVKTKVI